MSAILLASWTRPQRAPSVQGEVDAAWSFAWTLSGVALTSRRLSGVALELLGTIYIVNDDTIETLFERCLDRRSVSAPLRTLVLDEYSQSYPLHHVGMSTGYLARLTLLVARGSALDGFAPCCEIVCRDLYASQGLVATGHGRLDIETWTGPGWWDWEEDEVWMSGVSWPAL